MRRVDPSGALVVATHDSGQLGEMRTLLAPYARELRGAGELGPPEVEETGNELR